MTSMAIRAALEQTRLKLGASTLQAVDRMLARLELLEKYRESGQLRDLVSPCQQGGS